MKVDFETIVSAQYGAVASAEGLTVRGNVHVTAYAVERISSGTVSREDGVCVASFSSNGGGSKDVSFFGGVSVNEADILAAVNGFIAGAAETAAAQAEKGGEA